MTEPTSQPEHCWINGIPGHQVSALDRGFQYGDGVFETICVRKGIARFLPLHLQRLREGCERLNIGGVDFAAIEREVRAAALTSTAAILKLIVTRGPAKQRGYAADGHSAPTRVLTRYDDIAAAPSTARVGMSNFVLGENPSLAGVKHLNRLENVLARSSMPADLDEVLLCDGHGAVTGGSMSNLFLVRKRELLTPSLQRCGVAGIMRRVVMREAEALGLTVRETVLYPAELAVADEIFLTNARLGVWPVAVFATRRLDARAVSRALRERIEVLDGTA